jgi:hypothetical protein
VFVGLLIVSWFAMLYSHELGHIVCGYACGGRLHSADLLPWHLPYSMFEPDPFPLITLWGGPLVGTVAPLVLAMLVRRSWLWFIATFCLLANGMYIAVAWWSGDSFLDTTKLLAHGAHPATIAVYCIVTIGAGYYGFRRCCIQQLRF